MQQPKLGLASQFNPLPILTRAHALVAHPVVHGALAGFLVLAVANSRLRAEPLQRPAPPPPSAPAFRIATFNVENYLVRPAPGRKPKPESSRAHVARLIVESRADVVALQEVGDNDALRDLQRRLGGMGFPLPHAEIARGHDTNICVAVLSRFPFLHRRQYTNEVFLLDGRRLRSSRAFAEVSFSPTPSHRVILLVAHLKSKRAVGLAAESEMREQEALLLREKADALLRADPDANLVVCGDFNDTPDSPALRALVGRGLMALIDTRPAEPIDGGASPSATKRSITWTHHFAREDAYTRIDYLLVSRGLAREWRREDTRIHATPDWGLASDHRLLVVGFDSPDR